MADNHDNNTGGGSPNGEPLPSSAPPKTPRERIEQARDLAVDLYCECVSMVHYAGEVSDHYLKLIHTQEIKGEIDLDRGWLVLDVAWQTSQYMKRLGLQLERSGPLIEAHTVNYEGVSADPLTIGPITGSSAHATAVLLARHFLAFYREKAIKLIPVEGEGRPKPNDLSQEQLEELLPKWRESALRVRDEMLSFVGFDYMKSFDKWVAFTRVEAGKLLAAMPPAPTMTGEEQIVIHALLAGGNTPLTQGKLLDAAGLKDTGTNKAMLASMRQRGLLENQGKGYIVPAAIAAVVVP